VTTGRQDLRRPVSVVAPIPKRRAATPLSGLVEKVSRNTKPSLRGAKRRGDLNVNQSYGGKVETATLRSQLRHLGFVNMPGKRCPEMQIESTAWPELSKGGFDIPHHV